MAEHDSILWWEASAFALQIFGLLGNGLTVWAISYAPFKKKYDFAGVQWLITTVFILNLPIVDTVYCLFMVVYMLYGFMHSREVIDVVDGRSITINEEMSAAICKFFVLGFQQLTLIDGWSMALIAFTRGFPYIR